MSRPFDAELMSLEELDEYLMSDAAPEDSMMLSDLDGFLTAIAIGPELIMPSEWLPVIWGGDGPEFTSEAEANRVLSAIMGRYNEILDILANEPEAYEPIIYENRETGETIAADWAEGFLIGVDLRPASWQALLNSKSAPAFAPIAVFMPGEDGDFLVTEAHDPEVNEFRGKAGELLPAAVVEIDRFFKETRAFFHGAGKLGRNDPCFCGSGKKFKKCCGAARH